MRERQATDPKPRPCRTPLNFNRPTVIELDYHHSPSADRISAILLAGHILLHPVRLSEDCLNLLDGHADVDAFKIRAGEPDPRPIEQEQAGMT